MTSNLKPETPDGVVDAVAWAAAEETPLEVVGAGSRRGIGRPVQAEYTLNLSALTGVTLYEPEELVLSAMAGTPIAEIESLLAENGQELAFEPLDHGALSGGAERAGTIGGVLASNACGPRRLKAGAARDHVLGVKAVSGRGELFKSGGRVVKNVTGYDLSKGLAGSWGTLAVATELTFKVLPRAETQQTVVLSGLDDRAAVSAMCAAMGSPWEVSSAAHLPTGTASTSFNTSGNAVTLLRVEGFGPSVDYRSGKLVEQLKSYGDLEIADADASNDVWAAIRDVAPLKSDKPLWRISVAPMSGPEMVGALQTIDADYFYDWSGGLIWLQSEDKQNSHADEIRKAVAHVGGHATLMRGSPALRSSIEPFQPQEPALAALSRRLKEQFDPKGVLNPGRMAAGA